MLYFSQSILIPRIPCNLVKMKEFSFITARSVVEFQTNYIPRVILFLDLHPVINKKVTEEGVREHRVFCFVMVTNPRIVFEYRRGFKYFYPIPILTYNITPFTSLLPNSRTVSLVSKNRSRFHPHLSDTQIYNYARSPCRSRTYQ